MVIMILVIIMMTLITTIIIMVLVHVDYDDPPMVVKAVSLLQAS